MITQNYKNQTILLTGATSGIGLAQLNTYLDAGATVIAIDKEPIPVTHDRLTPYQLDLSDMTQLGEWIASHNDELSIVDIFLSTAGILDAFTPALDTDFTAIQQLMNVNVNAAVQLSLAILPHMVKRQAGQMVFMASIAGQIAGGGGRLTRCQSTP